MTEFGALETTVRPDGTSIAGLGQAHLARYRCPAIKGYEKSRNQIASLTRLRKRAAV